MSSKKPLFVILHGLCNTSWHVRQIEKKLRSLGHSTWSITYPSLKLSIEDNANYVSKELDKVYCGRPLIGIGHSMGGIVLRHLSERYSWKGSILIGSPNRGSSAAKHILKTPLINLFCGPSINDLATGKNWPMPAEPSTLFFSKSGFSIFCPQSLLLKFFGWKPTGDHDGLVTVDEVQCEIFNRVIELPENHVKMIKNQSVISEACSFVS